MFCHWLEVILNDVFDNLGLDFFFTGTCKFMVERFVICLFAIRGICGCRLLDFFFFKKGSW